MNKIPVAIVGLGRIASLLEDDGRREKPCTHAGAVAANNDCTLVSGCDTDETRRRLFAERWHVPIYPKAAAMLREHRPGILIIATDPSSHEEYCSLAYANGVPVAVCEKPLADTLARARKIASLAGQKLPAPGSSGGFKILVNHERRYSADYIRAREILESGRLGALISVRGVLYMGKGRRLIDVLWHDGTHLADAIMFLTGCTLRQVQTWGSPLKGREGTAYLEGLLALPQNTGPGARRGGGKEKEKEFPCVIELGAQRDHLVFEIEFSCEAGRLRIGNGVYEVWESADCPYAEGFRSLLPAPDRFQGKTGYFTSMIADAVNCVRNPSLQPRSSALDALKVIEYLDAVKSLR
ncbi:MAG: Gfo/Idh/MocA family oxidoreductase [Treponema sp.]|jgi:predicted dehydrogenase|nr:Gfo/Idh/MocA family oxidoreductase [Treponema sp.]